MRFRADLLDPGLWEGIEALADDTNKRGRNPKRRPPKASRKQVQRHLSSVEVDELIAQYQAGAMVLDLAAAYGIHRTTVLAVLERNQIPRRGRVWSPALTKQAIRLYAQGCSCAAIGDRLKVNPETVCQHLLIAGLTLRGPGRSLPHRSPRP